MQSLDAAILQTFVIFGQPCATKVFIFSSFYNIVLSYTLQLVDDYAFILNKCLICVSVVPWE